MTRRMFLVEIEEEKKRNDMITLKEDHPFVKQCNCAEALANISGQDNKTKVIWSDVNHCPFCGEEVTGIPKEVGVVVFVKPTQEDIDNRAGEYKDGIDWKKKKFISLNELRELILGDILSSKEIKEEQVKNAKKDNKKN